MNKNKKLQIAKNTARQILINLKDKNLFDGYVTRFFTNLKCINYIQKSINLYFNSGETQLVNWNKNTWMNIFDDENLVNSIVWYMQDFNLAKEMENELS